MEGLPLTATAAANSPMTNSQSGNQDNGWTNGKRKGGRINNTGSAAKQTKISDYWLGASTQNRFLHLSQDEGSSSTQGNPSNVNNEPSQEPERVPKPPPIFVHKVGQINPLITFLKTLAPNKHTIKSLHNDQVKIQTDTVDTYRLVLKALLEKKTELHSYQIKSERSFRVVLRGMHHSMDVEEIKAALLEKGHKATNVHNIKHHATKQPLPMFYIDLEANANNKDIYNLNVLCHCVVSFEPPRRKKEIAQCSRCQSFQHTKAFCTKAPRCVKCLIPHMSKDCPRKERDQHVQCVNCEQNHPANYKGCVVYKQLHQKLFKKIQNVRRPSPPIMEFIEPVGQRQQHISYANVLTGETAQEITQLIQPVQPVQPVVQPVVQPMQPAPQSTQNSNDGMMEIANMMKGLVQQMTDMMKFVMQQSSDMMKIFTAAMAAKK